MATKLLVLSLVKMFRKFTEYLNRMEEVGDGIVLTAQNAPFDVKQMNANMKSLTSQYQILLWIPLRRSQTF